MLGWIAKKIIGSKNQREVKKLQPIVDAINQFEETYKSLSDEALRQKTSEFKERLKKGETLEDIKVEAFAVVKNACRRLCGKSWQVCGYDLSWNMVPYDVQLVGGLVLHSGRIAEMATGEGKTLVATFPLYLNALTGENVQLVTVNEYLAQRDSEWVGKVFEFLGLTVGFLKNSMDFAEKKEMYNRDILYGTASEFGFDYLRDNGMAIDPSYQVQRSHFYCIIDEVDSILIDEARTPLIISGAIDTPTAGKYLKLKPRVHELVKKQAEYVARIIAEAEEKLKVDLDDEDGVKLLYQSGMGAPKNKRFLKLMENPKYKKIYERSNTVMQSDMNRKENQSIKEELFFTIDERNNQVALTEKGRDLISSKEDPEEFSVPDLVQFYQVLEDDESLDVDAKQKKKEAFQHEYEEKMEKIHNLSQLLKAYVLFEKDVDYVVQDEKVMIVDEFTGRLQPGRRYSDGLHQALEAKEGVKIEKESQTLASITIQNYFRLYTKLSGMTGTAETEADEFFQIYKMDVVVIPTNKSIVRDDMDDVIYKTKRGKYNAIIKDIEEKHKQGRPVLVGTVNVDISELISRMLKRTGIPHNVLNAKHHKSEAEIVAEAGQKGRVTIATNMAGRGTDIKLGPGVMEAGGLHIIGSERHESRRIDRQLRGRAGRQGDKGSSQFFISLEDDLMRLFGSDRIVGIMERMGMDETQEIQSGLLSRTIEKAQKKVEERNFNIRKHTLEFDDVMNQQRTIFYKTRNLILKSSDISEWFTTKFKETIEIIMDGFSNKEIAEEPRLVLNQFQSTWPMIDFSAIEKNEELDFDGMCVELEQAFKNAYDKKCKYEGVQNIRRMERYVALDVCDRLWKEHLRNMDDVKENAYLKAYGQRQPLQEYKKAAFEVFSEMMDRVSVEVCTEIFRLTSVIPHELVDTSAKKMNFTHESIDQFDLKSLSAQAEAEAAPVISENRPAEEMVLTPIKKQKEAGRNDPCPCGSGKKYKKCCAEKDQAS